MNTLTLISQAFLDLWLDAAFWLILGLGVAGLLQTFVKSDYLGRHLKGQGLLPAVKAAVLGIPLPLCSCGVIPAAVGLRRAGASKGATTAFLISTPETGVDSIAVSYALLGPFMTVIRPVAAICSAIAAAVFVNLGERKKTAQAITIKTAVQYSMAAPLATKASFSPSPQIQQAHQPAPSCHCCHSKKTPSSLGGRIWQGQVYAFTELLGDLSLWLIVGLIASACVIAFVPENTLAEISQGGWAMVIMALIGVPMYICASASTPLAAGLMLAGVSPGATLVFLLAGPATNVATLGIVRKEMGTRTLIGYLTGVIGVAIGFGYLTNFLVGFWQIDIGSELGHSHAFMPAWMVWSAALILAGLVLRDLWKRFLVFFHKPWRKSPAHIHHSD
ncbi:putative permease [Vibrio aerogenes CECT 7868]|uniref:Putative permease n=1 Tax=Vibrio aerogenes CECT 7868 TaxID=1216006 RepID=A0A1M6CGB2_9VIBR|nr:SO_0444 family Cu/Zn efflux transporter [Vibrio aerogenes]SHI60070.1 putative permease [Vibrio aerogenes CECT 7868]